MELGPDVVAVKVEIVLRCVEQAGDAGMLDHDAFGFTGRAGGVDDIGQMVGRDAQRVRVGIVVRLRIEDVVRVKQYGGQRGIRQCSGQCRLGKERYGRGIVEHIGEALGGVGRVEREIGGTRLEDGEQANNHLGAAFDANGDEVVGFDTEADEMMCELVGALVKCLIGERV
ncbi:hypothetical protein PB72LOC_04446 [Pectobacterium atrosepticum]|nr:hypothetical protein PB72LOC_04446 [Pectobacterium atrosepticum]